ncbi:MAG: hypothetical protein Q4E69_02525 [Bacilli bacterium]|nr:hypothetical protein [Bacilli bacterium]
MAKKKVKGNGTIEIILGLIPFIIILLFAISTGIKGIGFAPGGDRTYGLEAILFTLVIVLVFARAYPYISIPILGLSIFFLYRGIKKRKEFYQNNPTKKRS